MRTTALAVALLAMTAVGAGAQTPAPPPPRDVAAAETISVSGVGRVTLAPDRASFSVGVQSMGPTVAAAVQDNNARVAAIVAALRKLGATDREIRTSQVSIYPQQDAQPNRAPRIVGYQVSNNVSVIRPDVSDVGRYLQAAVDAGANTVSGVSFTVSDPAKGRDAGLSSAFADARAKADVLARAAGRTVGRALSITEGSAITPPPYPFARGAMMEAAAKMDVPVEPGAEELTFTVSVVFELR
jgi:uncharacterized protein YggE